LLIQRGINSTIMHSKKMEFSDIVRHFSDISKMDPCTNLSNKLAEIIKDLNRPIEIRLITKLLRNITQTKSPRLYTGLVKSVLFRLQNTITLKEENTKSI
jgi:hypothetical protein